jgi:hypothetical protein
VGERVKCLSLANQILNISIVHFLIGSKPILHHIVSSYSVFALNLLNLITIDVRFVDNQAFWVRPLHNCPSDYSFFGHLLSFK